MARTAGQALGAVLLSVTVLAACAVGPDYTRPDVDVPAGWRIDYPQAAAVANTQWWNQFGDPVLDQLIVTALEGNKDVVIAAARVDQFLGQLTTTRSQFYPQLSYGGDVSRNRESSVGVVPLAPGTDPYYTLYQGSLGAAWQLDLFGKLRRQSEAAQAQVYASEQGRRGVVLSLVTTVAASYITLRALDRQLEISRATASNYAGTKRIFDLRFQRGVVSKVEVSQIESQYEQAQAAVPALERQIAAQENLIAVLLGENPGPIPRGKTIDQLTAPVIPADLPSTLLERRPDILQAEQFLVAANANVGATEALYFPTISLTGALGSVSAAASDFLSGPATAWSAAAGVTGPLFTFGNIEGQVASAKAFKREAVANYQLVILNAFRETNDALFGAEKKRAEADAQDRRVAALREYARLSKLKFDSGYASYLEVLYADNELFGAELAAVRSQADSYTQIVDVYKALGGGWVDAADVLAPQPELGGRRTEEPAR
jgi:multidrug efflux system outer membrane protein